MESIRAHALDIVLTLILWAAEGLVHFLMSPFPRFFVERDPTLSYPWEIQGHGEEVPNWLVGVLSIPVVMILLYIIQVTGRSFSTDNSPHPVHPKVFDWFVIQLSFLEAMGVNMLMTDFLKSFEGRKRPNFFAMCNYHGYRDALATNSFEEYLNLTVPGRPGNMSFCRETDLVFFFSSSFLNWDLFLSFFHI
eukprot:TRINITY_DN14473_c0_g1_i1.p1 TRINITY_DN14473_c0_g1~~TRINITY_DN14473_c0_g1_i1.p1  ORF type:complete len:192 (+),score=20.74 TRINITY_DN14473_c0_g1_i1:291-866(+)